MQVPHTRQPVLQVNFEAGAAWLTDKHVIPACFKGLSKEKLPKPYSSLQAINLNEAADQCYLLHSVCHYLGKLSVVIKLMQKRRLAIRRAAWLSPLTVGRLPP